MKSQFLAHMSHELRTPLHHIIGFTELVREEAADRLDQPQREALDDVMRASSHLLSLINDVLDMARVESGAIELTREEVDVPALLASAMAAARDSAEKSGITLRLEADAIPRTAWVDARRLSQTLSNLLSNAVKFTPSGGNVLLKVERVEPGTIQFQVSDTGIGISEADLDGVFTPFEKVRKGATRYPGAGLGLSLARKNVELHGGRVWVHSAGPGQGATFSFTIPLAVSSAALPGDDKGHGAGPGHVPTGNL